MVADRTGLRRLKLAVLVNRDVEHRRKVALEGDAVAVSDDGVLWGLDVATAVAWQISEGQSDRLLEVVVRGRLREVGGVADGRCQPPSHVRRQAKQRAQNSVLETCVGANATHAVELGERVRHGQGDDDGEAVGRARN